MLSDEHPKKDILPDSLRNGNGDAQPGDLPEYDEIWFSNKRARTYGQQLAQQVFVSFCIDPAEGIEPIMHLQLARFLGEIMIKEQKAALKAAKEDLSDLCLWSDRSKEDKRGAGAAVVWKNCLSHEWNICKLLLGKNKEIFNAEL